MPEAAAKMTCAKQAFSGARQKRLPDAFTLLNDELIRAYCEDGDFKTCLGFRWLAVNGSVSELPNTQETQKEYGYATDDVQSRASDRKGAFQQIGNQHPHEPRR